MHLGDSIINLLYPLADVTNGLVRNLFH